MGRWVGSSVLILLVCLCINYPELRTLPGRGAARSRITGFIITCCRLLITENYEQSAGVGWVVMADGGATDCGWGATDGCWEERHPSQICVFN